MAVSVDQIKTLRKDTGAGIADCRTALEEAKGNLAKAKEILRAKGLAKAEKKAGREVKSGLVEAYIHATGKVGAMVEVACETDFVARTDEFKKLCHELAMQVASMDPPSVKDLLTQEYIRDPQMTVEQLVKETIGKLGENIVIRRISRLVLGE
jgi:elongation factor Ts